MYMYYSPDDVELSYSGDTYLYILGAESTIAYGFRSDAINNANGYACMRRVRYVLYTSFLDCLSAIRGQVIGKPCTFVIRRNGSVVLICEPIVSFWHEEQPFRLNKAPRWSVNEINAVVRSVVSTMFRCREQCLCFSLAILYGLLSPQGTDFSMYTNRGRLSSTYLYIQEFGSDVWSYFGHSIFTEACEKLSSSRLIELVNTGAALQLGLDCGARLRRRDGSVDVMDCMHSVVLLRLDDDDLCLIDQHGCWRIDEEDVDGLCESSVYDNAKSCYGGCVILGVRKDGYMFSANQVANVVRGVDDDCLIDVFSEDVIYDSDFDVSRIAKSPIGVFDIDKSSFKREFIDFYQDNFRFLNNEGAFLGVDVNSNERDISFVQKDRTLEQVFEFDTVDLTSRDVSFIGDFSDSIETESFDDEYVDYL